MKYTLEDRAERMARYIINTGATVRETAKHFGTTKSTVHRDVTERLQRSDRALYLEVRTILENHRIAQPARATSSTNNILNAPKEEQ